MFKMKKLALAGALAMIAAAATAAQPGHLADRHAARSVDCAACHKGHEQSVLCGLRARQKAPGSFKKPSRARDDRGGEARKAPAAALYAAPEKPAPSGNRQGVRLL